MIRIALVLATMMMIILIMGQRWLEEVDPIITPQQQTITGLTGKIQDRYPPTPQQRIDAAFQIIDLACRVDGRITVCTNNVMLPDEWTPSFP